jgi:acetoin utilization deacetylase AcuC-like enzyme
MTLQVIYSSKYKEHLGFYTSLENPDRLSKIIRTSTKYFSDRSNQTIDKKWTDIIQRLYDTYSKIKTVNCIRCTFENPIGLSQCVMCGTNSRKIKIISPTEGDTTYFRPSSIECLTHLLHTISHTLHTQIKTNKNTMILSRPPGHHCDNVTPQGFCLINNISFAVDVLQKKGYKRIAIVDWDLHHGNGTQKIFYDNQEVLFVDIHCKDIYPFTGKVTETGEGDGVGYTMNIEVEKQNDEVVYLSSFENHIIPKLQRFNPDWILVSCGFDAHKDDPFKLMKLETSSYVKFHNYLTSLKKPLTYLLEGGYNKNVIKECVDAISINKN